MMRLPKVLEQKLWQDIDQIEGETKMRYVTSIERLAIERGMQQGIEKGILQGCFCLQIFRNVVERIKLIGWL
jgi:hypothetical protein